MKNTFDELKEVIGSLRVNSPWRFCCRRPGPCDLVSSRCSCSPGGSSLAASASTSTWSSSDGAVIKFGEVGGISAANPHSMALSQFTTQLNQHKCLSDTLLQIIRSHKLCKALGRLPITCSVGTVLDPTVQLPRTHFSGLWRELFLKRPL